MALHRCTLIAQDYVDQHAVSKIMQVMNMKMGTFIIKDNKQKIDE